MHGRISAQLAVNNRALQTQRDTIAGRTEEMLDHFPVSPRSRSRCLSVDIKTASNILLPIDDCQNFDDAAHLTPYAGIAPATSRPVTSIR
ncbi:hypothetical protein WU86_10445 [Corynebacterium xerosis]|nr:hypothetical protein WU86_10445 [Corynebacterium xerosis]